MTNKPWVSGPLEVLSHALNLIEIDNDKNRRIAMILVDNSVELTLKTYLNLPKRINGLNIPKKEKDQFEFGFPSLLDGIEKYAGEKLDGISLEEIEWFHRVRNSLYHQGNGITVERKKVEAYSQIAQLLIKNLFDVELTLDESAKLEQDFLKLWEELDSTIALWGRTKGIGSIDDCGEFIHADFTILTSVLKVPDYRVWSQKEIDRFEEVKDLRTRIINQEILSPNKISKGITYMKDLINEVKIGIDQE